MASNRFKLTNLAEIWNSPPITPETRAYWNSRAKAKNLKNRSHSKPDVSGFNLFVLDRTVS